MSKDPAIQVTSTGEYIMQAPTVRGVHRAEKSKGEPRRVTRLTAQHEVMGLASQQTPRRSFTMIRSSARSRIADADAGEESFGGGSAHLHIPELAGPLMAA